MNAVTREIGWKDEAHGVRNRDATKSGSFPVAVGDFVGRTATLGRAPPAWFVKIERLIGSH